MRIRANLFVALFLSMFLAIAAPCLSQAEAFGKYQKSVEKYSVPDVILYDQNGKEVRIQEYLNADKPILIDFIFATCSTICPVLSASFAYFQKNLGENLESVQIVSFTIDPDHDTPEHMKEYLARYGAKPGWDAFTGRKEHIDQVLKSLDAYVGNKMEHYPLILMKAPGKDTWVRLNGLMSFSSLKKEFAELNAQ